MEKRFWHALGKSTHPFGIGCWQISGNHSVNNKPNGWGEVSENEAIQILQKAIEFGFDFFDTAHGYNSGLSEKRLGKAIKNIGKEVVVCTKLLLTEDEIKNKKIGVDFLNRVDVSLNNLQSTKIDVLLIHNPPDDLEWKDFDCQVLNDLIKQKLIGTYGVSSRSLKGAKLALDQQFGTVIEWVYNIFERRPLIELFPELEQNKVNFIGRSPLSRGLINPKYLYQNPNFLKNDFRSTLPLEWVNWTLNNLSKFSQNGISDSEIVKMALFYCIESQVVTSSIVGVKSIEQLTYLKNVFDILQEFEPKYLNEIPEFFPPWK